MLMHTSIQARRALDISLNQRQGMGVLCLPSGEVITRQYVHVARLSVYIIQTILNPRSPIYFLARVDRRRSFSASPLSTVFRFRPAIDVLVAELPASVSRRSSSSPSSRSLFLRFPVTCPLVALGPPLSFVVLALPLA